MSKGAIRLDDIAAEAGVSRTTVSMVLNDHPRISAATKKRVRRICLERGYHVDPAARALAQKKLGGKSGPVYLGTLAFLESREFHALKKTYSQHKMWDGQFERICQEMGYRLNHFVVGSTDREQHSLNRVLVARGIRGVIINGSNEAIQQWKLDWAKFASVVYSGSLHEHFIHNVTSSSYQDVYDAMLRLREKQYKRPGCFLRPRFDHWSAGFSSAIENWVSDGQIPKLILEGTVDEEMGRKEFLRWYERYKPDVIVANCGDQLVRLLAEEKICVGSEVGYVCLDIQPGMEQLSGLIQKRSAAFQVLVDLLHGMLMRHELGPPSDPLCVQIPSLWNEGQTLR